MNSVQIVPHVLALAAAYAFAFPIGWDREKEARSAGLRTFPLVALASCGFVQGTKLDTHMTSIIVAIDMAALHIRVAAQRPFDTPLWRTTAGGGADGTSRLVERYLEKYLVGQPKYALPHIPGGHLDLRLFSAYVG